MSNCPKCDKKIGAFYFKQSCPHCGANLMYYDFDNRLKEDAAKAEEEWAAVGKLTDGIKKSAIGSLPAILRLLSFFVPVVALLIPTFKFNETNLTLVSIIKQVISSSSDVFGNKALLLCLICFALAIVFALVNLVVSLFSYTKHCFFCGRHTCFCRCWYSSGCCGNYNLQFWWFLCSSCAYDYHGCSSFCS